MDENQVNIIHEQQLEKKEKEKPIKFIKCGKCLGNLLHCDCKWPPAEEIIKE